MQVQLKQTEIIAALKLYIQSQGINLSGKKVEISFTAGRRESGLTADLSINDAVQQPLVEQEVVLETAVADQPEQIVTSTDTPSTVVEKTTSLFGA